MLYYLDWFGTFVFAIAGALVAHRRKSNWIGGVILAVLTALGGGTIRDIVLGITPVFWIEQPLYLFAASATGLLMFLTASYRIPNVRLMKLADCVGLAAFTIVGTQVGLAMQIHWWISAVMGLLTGVGGGLMRDALVAETPWLFKQKEYALASLVGGLIYAALVQFGIADVGAIALAFILIVLIRLGSHLRAVALVSCLAFSLSTSNWTEHRKKQQLPKSWI